MNGEGTLFEECEDGLFPTSDGDRDRSATLANPAATSFTRALWHQSCMRPIRIPNDRAERREGRPMLRSLKELEHYAVSAATATLEVLRIFSWTMSAG